MPPLPRQGSIEHLKTSKEILPMLGLYATALFLLGLWAVDRIFNMSHPLLNAVGFLLVVGVTVWMLVMWIFGSLTGATACSGFLGALILGIIWFIVSRFGMTATGTREPGTEGAFLFLNGLPFVVIGGTLLGWICLRPLRPRLRPPPPQEEDFWDEEDRRPPRVELVD
jgi:hypothetical protein